MCGIHFNAYYNFFGLEPRGHQSCGELVSAWQFMTVLEGACSSSRNEMLSLLFTVRADGPFSLDRE